MSSSSSGSAARDRLQVRLGKTVVVLWLILQTWSHVAAEDQRSVLQASGFIHRSGGGRAGSEAAPGRRIRDPIPASAAARRVDLIPPEAGEDYEIKVIFLKAETFSSLIDDFFESRSDIGIAPPKSDAVTWHRVRQALPKVRSRADFRVLGADGELVREVQDVGALTWGRTVKLTADSPSYTVEIRCIEGAGLFHLRFERD